MSVAVVVASEMGTDVGTVVVDIESDTGVEVGSVAVCGEFVEFVGCVLLITVAD
ncbi:MAG: hypothetical protein HZB09_02070 [Candidatus Yonathbacteria bacterium]|nr:hypothetical protein [Candidatus Yonathbacteria bacterium]